MAGKNWGGLKLILTFVLKTSKLHVVKTEVAIHIGVHFRFAFKTQVLAIVLFVV